MPIDLNAIRDKDLIKGSYSEIIEIIEALEGVNPFKFSGISAIETLETYRSYAYIIKGRILSNEIKELSGNDKRREKSILHTRLNIVIDHITSSLEINGLLNEQTAYITDTIDKAKKELSEQRQKIDKKAEIVQDQIDNSEHTILSHVLTLMGIFSAIITIILSVIITSSSWINNADKADAVVAFVVPNAVALMAVSLLLSLIFLHNRRNRINTNQTKHGALDICKSVVCYSIIIVVILATIISSISLSIKSDIDPNPIHTLYILSPGEYRIQEEVVAPASADGSVEAQKQSFFEFTFEDKLYRFEYDESYLHNGNLYFCEKHYTLE